MTFDHKAGKRKRKGAADVPFNSKLCPSEMQEILDMDKVHKSWWKNESDEHVSHGINFTITNVAAFQQK